MILSPFISLRLICSSLDNLICKLISLEKETDHTTSFLFSYYLFLKNLTISYHIIEDIDINNTNIISPIVNGANFNIEDIGVDVYKRQVYCSTGIFLPIEQ